MKPEGRQPPSQPQPQPLTVLYAERTVIELGLADALLGCGQALTRCDRTPSCSGGQASLWQGCLAPEVAVVKGIPSVAELAGGAAFSGADGDAAIKALAALGHDTGQVFFALSRPPCAQGPEAEDGGGDAAPGGGGGDAIPRRLRLLLESVDAPLVIATDMVAATDLSRAFDLPEEIEPGCLVHYAGRRFVACTGLEASLAGQDTKRRVWKQLLAATPEKPVY
ncbi:MAG: hypothetical protein FWE94_01345 [Coriobacteriia bacterium]|nr:hypothetical protein [Coriobacteriia bacterium]